MQQTDYSDISRSIDPAQHTLALCEDRNDRGSAQRPGSVHPYELSPWRVSGGNGADEHYRPPPAYRGI